MSDASDSEIRTVYSVSADDADWLAFDSKGCIPDSLTVRCFTAVLNRNSRRSGISIPLSESERKRINDALAERLDAKKDGPNEQAN